MTVARFDDDLDNDIQYYLKDVSQYPLLSAAEERRLGERIQAGQAAQSNGYCRLCDRVCIEAGEQAQRRLTEGNLRWVVKIAKRYHCQGLTLMDLVQEGNLGLMHAAKKFNPARARFTSHATWWIRQAIGRAINERGALIHVPSYKWAEMNRLEQARDACYAEGYEPTPARIAAHLHISEQAVVELQRQTNLPLSLDVAYYDNDEDGYTLAGLLPANDEDLSEGAAEKELAARVDAALAELEAREAAILRHRYGVGMEREYTLEETARMVGSERDSSVPVTRERVRQVEVKAKRKLRPALERQVRA